MGEIDVPVGEYPPQMPTMPRVCKDMDQLNRRLDGLMDANAELQLRILELQGELADRITERDRARKERDDARATMPRGLG